MIPKRSSRNVGAGKRLKLPAYINQTYNKLYTPVRRGSATDRGQEK